MARYDRGYDRSFRPRRRDWSDPYGDTFGSPFSREHAGSRPWVGGYRQGYQGGSGGIRTGGAEGPAPRYGKDYWWLGEHELERHGPLSSYDAGYRDFDRQAHPRYSPIGGNYHPMGGSYLRGRPPRPLREDSWFSEWTRWF